MIFEAVPPEEVWEVLLRGALRGRAEALHPTPELDSQGRPREIDNSVVLVLSQHDKLNCKRTFGALRFIPKDLLVCITEVSWLRGTPAESLE